jgi:ABC-type multidrug transport system fused ATPase/permease subunit
MLNFPLFWSILKSKQKRTIGLLLFISFVSSFLDVVGIGLVIPIISIVINPNLFLQISKQYLVFFNLQINEYVTNDEIFFKIFFISVVLFFFFRFLLNILFGYYRTKLFWFFSASLSSSLVDNYFNQKKNFFNEVNSNAIIRNVTEIPNLITQHYLGNFYNLLFESGVVFLLFISFFILDVKIASLIFIFVSLFLFLFISLNKKKITTYGENSLEYTKERVKNLREYILGFREIRLAKKNDIFKRNINKYNYRLALIIHKLNFKDLFSRGFFELIVVCIFIIIFYLMHNNKVDAAVLISTLSYFSLALLRMLPAINKILSAFQRMYATLPAIKILKNEFERFYYPEFSSDETISFNKQIEIRKLSFEYNSEKILKNINVKIKKNSIFAIIGRSGVGKTTLLSLISGFDKPKKGFILTDGKNISANLEQWQSFIGYVPQEIFIKDDDIVSNVCLGVDRKNLDKKRLAKVLKYSHLDKFVNLKKFEVKKNLKTGESGAMLSGGQIQRIGIARALYLNPKILILDEPTKSLDPLTEIEIMRDLKKMKKFLTIIIVSHNPAIKSIADNVLQLK